MLSNIKKIKTNNSCIVKKTPIIVTQHDVDRLNRKIRRDIKKVKENQTRTIEIAEETLMI
ncbi:MAG: hypothetical protein IJY90_02330 [Clostridia bacterium]|nr:hypothetical protein [Clostridia bacterium]